MRRLFSVLTLLLLASCGASVPAYAITEQGIALCVSAFMAGLMCFSLGMLVLIIGIFAYREFFPRKDPTTASNSIGFIDTNKENNS